MSSAGAAAAAAGVAQGLRTSRTGCSAGGVLEAQVLQPPLSQPLAQPAAACGPAMRPGVRASRWRPGRLAGCQCGLRVRGA